MSFKLTIKDDDGISLTPFFKTLKGYSLPMFGADLKAGLNVAMLSFPITMAYALIAGLPISYGIFGGIISGAVSAFFSNSRYVIFGPSNATAVMLMSSFAAAGLATEGARVAILSAIVLLVGIFMILASIFKITYLISYISRPVVIAYVTAAALLIIANQVKNILGIHYADGEDASTLVDICVLSVKHFSQIHWEPTVTAILSLLVLCPLKRFFPKLPAEAIVLAVLSTLIYAAAFYTDFNTEKLSPVSFTSWEVSLPDFSILPVRETIISALALALLATLEAVSIGKNFAAKNADRFATNQEVFSLGVANMACAGLSGMTASGSLARSVLGNISGAKTSLVNVFTTLFTLLLLFVFGGLLGFVPKATLATIVMYAGYKLISIKNIKIALKTTRSDAIVFALTLLTGICSTLDDAIYVGVAASVLLFLKKASRPEIVEYVFMDDGELAELGNQNKRPDPEISIVHIEGNMFFGASDVLQNQLRRISDDENLKVLILKLRNAINFDATSIMDLEELSMQMKRSNRTLMLCEVKPDLMKILKTSGASGVLGADNIFEYTEGNTTLSAARALRKAKDALQGQSPKVTIFA